MPKKAVKRKRRQKKALEAQFDVNVTGAESKSKKELLRDSQAYADARRKPKVKATAEALEGNTRAESK